MMGNWGYPSAGSGLGGMMNWSGGAGWFGLVGTIFWIVILVDLVLLGIWLWKQIGKK